MSWHFALLVATTCWTYALPPGIDDAVQGIYIPLQKETKIVEDIVPKLNAYHPLVRFKPLEVCPAYFYIVDRQPDGGEETNYSDEDLLQLLISAYKEQYNKPPPTEMTRRIIRFGTVY